MGLLVDSNCSDCVGFLTKAPMFGSSGNKCAAERVIYETRNIKTFTSHNTTANKRFEGIYIPG